MTDTIRIVVGALMIAGVLAGLIICMARISGWRVTFAIWGVSAVLTAIVVAGAILIGAGT